MPPFSSPSNTDKERGLVRSMADHCPRQMFRGGRGMLHLQNRHSGQQVGEAGPESSTSHRRSSSTGGEPKCWETERSGGGRCRDRGRGGWTILPSKGALKHQAGSSCWAFGVTKYADARRCFLKIPEHPAHGVANSRLCIQRTLPLSCGGFWRLVHSQQRSRSLLLSTEYLLDCVLRT